MFISEAYAQSAGASAQGQLVQFLPIILMFVVLYFLMIRPQMKRAKETRAMIEALKKGDEVVTSGGIVGKIIKVTDGYITLEVGRQGNDAVEMTFQRAAVQTLLPNGTIKSI